MSKPTPLNLLPGYESDEAEVELSPAVQTHENDTQTTKSPTPLHKSPAITVPASPEPATNTNMPAIPNLLPGYESDEEEAQPTSPDSRLKIVVSSATITKPFQPAGPTAASSSSASLTDLTPVPAPTPALSKIPTADLARPLLRRSPRLIERRIREAKRKAGGEGN